jgi:predicted PurR-regulated permease PerM
VNGDVPVNASTPANGNTPTPGPWERLKGRARANGVPLPSILVVAGVVVALYLGAKLLYIMRTAVFLFATAAFLALLVDPVVVTLQKRITRRGIAVAIVTAWVLLLFIGLALLFGYPLVNGLTHFANHLPRYVRRAEAGHGWIGHLIRRYHLVHWAERNVPKIESFARRLAGPALQVGKSVASLVVTVGLLFALVLLLLLEAPKMRVAFLQLLPEAKSERLRNLGAEVSASVSGFILGDFITSLSAGLVVFVTLAALGVPYPALWAIWVALVDFLPQIGGALAGIPTVIFALAHSLFAGIVTAVVFIAYTQIENHVLNPIVMSRTVKMNPLLVFSSVLLAANFGGFIGGPFGGFVAAVLAIPVAGALQIVVRDIWRNSQWVPRTRTEAPSDGEGPSPTGELPQEAEAAGDAG